MKNKIIFQKSRVVKKIFPKKIYVICDLMIK